MTLNEMTTVLDANHLVSIEEESGEVHFCCNFGDLTIGDLKPIRDRTVKTIYPEAYGKYYGWHGITIVLKSI